MHKCMDAYRAAALARGLSAPPEGVSWTKHLATLPDNQRMALVQWLRSLPTVSDPVSDAISAETRSRLASLPSNPTEQDFTNAGLHFTPARIPEPR